MVLIGWCATTTTVHWIAAQGHPHEHTSLLHQYYGVWSIISAMYYASLRRPPWCSDYYERWKTRHKETSRALRVVKTARSFPIDRRVQAKAQGLEGPLSSSGGEGVDWGDRMGRESDQRCSGDNIQPGSDGREEGERPPRGCHDHSQEWCGAWSNFWAE